MKVICKPVDRPAYDADMTMDEIRDFIGGWLEHVRIDRSTHLLCDEEGLLKCRPANCAIEGTMYHGPIVILGLNGRGDDFGDSPMTADEAMMVFPGLRWSRWQWLQNIDKKETTT